MKIFPKLLFALALLIVICLFVPSMAHAQTVTDPGCDPLDPGCPIDGGVSALIAVGIGYGIKLKKARTSAKNS